MDSLSIDAKSSDTSVVIESAALPPTFPNSNKDDVGAIPVAQS